MSEYELKENIGYNKELCETIPFKVCSLEQMIYQTEESLHPEEILADEYDITEVSYKTWILPLKIDSLDGNTVSIIVPDGQYAIDHINKKYSKFLEVSLAEVMNQEFQIKLISHNSLKIKSMTYQKTCISHIALQRCSFLIHSQTNIWSCRVVTDIHHS